MSAIRIKASTLLAFLLSVYAPHGGLLAQDDNRSEDGISLELSTSLQQVIEDTASAFGANGISAAVHFPGAGTWVGSFGLSDSTTPFSPDMASSVGSLTKTATGALILQLVEEGAIELDDPIGNWLPEIANIPLRATIRQPQSYQRHPKLRTASGIWRFDFRRPRKNVAANRAGAGVHTTGVVHAG